LIKKGKISRRLDPILLFAPTHSNL